MKPLNIYISILSLFFQVAFSILVIQSTVAWAIPEEHKEKRSLTGSFPFAAHHQHSQGTVFKTEKKSDRKKVVRDQTKAKGILLLFSICVVWKLC